MNNNPLANELGDAIIDGDVIKVRDLFSRHPDLLSQEHKNYFLRRVAQKNDVNMMTVLVQAGADINAPDDDLSPENGLVDAARDGAIDGVRWLLTNGAKINHKIDGKTRCFALTGAVREGYLDIVKLLIQYGADINAIWADNNALSFALMYGQQEIADYLRSKGALEPWQIRGEPPPQAPTGPATLLEHIEQHLGKPQPLALREIVPGTPSIAIHVVLQDDCLALVTTGMSDQPMTVPQGEENYQYAELVMYLPKDWPLTDKAFKDPKHFWPIHWLRRIARYPHDNATWLHGKVAIFANDDPPQPLAPNTKLSCLMALTESSEFGAVRLADGRLVQFYSVYPLYTEERDLEREKGVVTLLELFQERGISKVVDLKRPNVTKPPKRRWFG